jgi:hypothetical protein
MDKTTGAAVVAAGAIWQEPCAAEEGSFRLNSRQLTITCPREVSEHFPPPSPSFHGADRSFSFSLPAMHLSSYLLYILAIQAGRPADVLQAAALAAKRPLGLGAWR